MQRNKINKGFPVLKLFVPHTLKIETRRDKKGHNLMSSGTQLGALTYY